MAIRKSEGKTLFTCQQASDGMFYFLRGGHLKTAGMFNVQEAE
jgi:hypothetical protein